MAALTEHAGDGSLNPGVVLDHQDPRGAHRPASGAGPKPSRARRRLLVVRVPIPAPVATFPLLRLGAGGPLLLGTFALTARGASRWPRPRPARPRPCRAEGPPPGPPPGRGGPPKPPDRGGRRSRRAGAVRQDRGTTGSARRPAGAAGPGRSAGAGGTAGAGRGPAEAARTWSGRLRLRLLDDDGPALQHSAGQLLDGGLGAVVGRRFDERETTRTAGLTIERDTHAPQLECLRR